MRLPLIVLSTIVVLAVLLVAACTPAATPTPTQAPTPTPTHTPTPTSPPVAIAPTATPTPQAISDVREIAIQATFPRFSPAEITVKAGEKVRFVVTSTDSFHTFTFTVLGVDVSINGGETKTVEVTIPADVTEIPFWCKPHQGAGMTGKLIVEGVQPPMATPTPTPPTPTATPTPTSTPTPTVAPTATETPMAVAQVKLGKSDTLGAFLTDASGKTLYLYTRDTQNVSNCYDQCAQRWPPLLTTDKPTAGEGVVVTLLGTTTRKDGSTQVTYNGWPLYYWWQDAEPGDTKGQNVGNVWFVLTADGAPVQNNAPVKQVMNDVLGRFLADQSGRTLYMYTRDTQNVSNCYDQCAQRWPPLLTVGAPTAGEGTLGAFLGTTSRKDGSTQVTYNGWPLYYWWQDAKPGDTKGQNVGGVWFVLAPDGTRIEIMPPATPTPTQQPGMATPTPAPTPTPTPTPAPTVREIKVTATLPTFNPSVIEVKAGETVRFVVTSTDMYHTFTVPNLGIDLQLDAGQTQSAEVTIPSDRAEIEFYCDPHLFAGMKGKIMVLGSSQSTSAAPASPPSYDYGTGY